MDDLLSEFLTETAENMAVLDVELVQLEQNPNDSKLLSSIFRIVHTIKGTCGFLGLPRLEKVAHASENILGKFRDQVFPVTPPAVSLILESLDRIKMLLAELEATQKEPAGEDGELIARLNYYAEHGATADAAIAAPMPTSIDEIDFTPIPAPAEYLVPAEPRATAPAAPVAEAPPAAEQSHSPAVHAPVAAVSAAPAPTAESKDSALANQSIRVNVDVLENLMTMVSELVLTRNQLLQMLRGQKDSEFTTPLQRLNHIVSELQEGVMKTRMQPIGNAWSKLPRIIRDLGVELSKKIDLVMLGADTELDRQVLELIKDPLTHMVRNSCDHGLETPAERLRAGKPEMGKVILNAYHEGGHIIIEIKDDGRGLPLDKIKKKALQNGLATEADLEAMSDQQIYQLIFKPGFSTAEKVTSVSGRGVGMDVVKTNIEKIGGTIELNSVWGRGSTFTIKIPLTLAIVSALIVESSGERFAIPQISVVELVRASGNSDHRIERINGTPVLRLRNRLLPLVSLEKLLHLDGPSTDKAANDNETYIVVTQVGTFTFGIIVDRVFDTEEIVVKPVSPILRHIEMFSGNTILGDGSVIMILDPNGIAAAGSGEFTGAATEDAASVAHADRMDDSRQSLLLFSGVAGQPPMAVPLQLVARLEDIDVKDIEYSNGKPVVQYRGKLMPLVHVSDSFNSKPEGSYPVIVFADGDNSMGLIVEEIVDIIEDNLRVQLKGERAGLMGSAVINGKATEMIDVAHYLNEASRDWFSSSQREAYEQARSRRVLLVDDSPFFRNMLTPLLSVAGYQVTTVASAAEALERCNAGEDFDVIVSDIEMPGMSGFELAHKLRSDQRYQNTPLVALSAFSSQRDLDRGRAAGFTDYVPKHDRESLLATLSQTLTDLSMRGVA